jgi:signal transduction histidine kinase
MRARSLFAIVTRSLVTYSVLVSLLFLAGIISIYRDRLHEQRADAAERINLLLQVSLENAMLKRDIPGLEEIVSRLGRQQGIDAVMILNPQGQVRFASRPELLNRTFDLSKAELCADCVWDRVSPIERTELLPERDGRSVTLLRSVKSVANRDECKQCHGERSASPFNGLLVVDHDANDLKRNALIGALALAGSGMVVVLALLAGLYRVLRRHVLDPVATLQGASMALAAGDLSRRVEPRGDDELSDLGRSFNTMAERLKRSRDQLADRERFVQALLDALPDGVRVIGPDFRIILANKAYRDLLGLGEAQQAGSFCYASSHGRSEPCVPTLVTCPLVALSKDNDNLKYHAHYARGDGAEVSVEIKAARVAIETESGPRMVVIEVIRDLDAAVRISHEQRLSELGQLATGVAHEIRNPLSSVAMLMSDVEANLQQADVAAALPSLRLIGQEVDRCLAITDSLLKLGTPPGLSDQLISLADVVADILLLLRFQAGEGQVEVVSRLEPGLRMLGSDGDLRIVLINLIQNAFHAMPGGGRLTIACRREGARIVMSFSDTGVGIAAEDIRSIFLPFWSKRADGVHGTGLGLAICQSVIKGLGGEMSVTSRPGEGTTFFVILPDPDAGCGGES